MSDLIGKKFPVLNHGHVVLVDVMGNDGAIVDAARTCYQKGTRPVSDDRTLLRFLMRHRHTSPFESCSIKFHIKLPIFVERQWARHRTAGWNEVSARYSELPEETYVPTPESVCVQSATNRQGRGDTMEEYAEEFIRHSNEHAAKSFEVYHADLKQEVARELARINLPLSTYTEKVWWTNLHNLLHFLALRMDSHAQKEIRDYATVIGERIVKPLFPITYEAFEDYRLGAVMLTRLDVLASQFCQSEPGLAAFEAACHTIPDLKVNGWDKEKCRERDECRVKLERLGIL